MHRARAISQSAALRPGIFNSPSSPSPRTAELSIDYTTHSSRPKDLTHSTEPHPLPADHGRHPLRHLPVRFRPRQAETTGTETNAHNRTVVKRNAVFLSTIFVGAFVTNM